MRFSKGVPSDHYKALVFLKNKKVFVPDDLREIGFLSRRCYQITEDLERWGLAKKNVYLTDENYEAPYRIKRLSSKFNYILTLESADIPYNLSKPPGDLVKLNYRQALLIICILDGDRSYEDIYLRLDVPNYLRWQVRRVMKSIRYNHPEMLRGWSINECFTSPVEVRPSLLGSIWRFVTGYDW